MTFKETSCLIYQVDRGIIEDGDIRTDTLTIFDLYRLNDTNFEDKVLAAVERNLYHPTMFIQADELNLEKIFDCANGYGHGNGHTRSLIKKNAYSMSVGDVVYMLESDTSYVCMPMGWEKINVTLDLNKG